MSRIFLTGSGGFVGNRLLGRLAALADVVCLDLRAGPKPDGVTVLRGDLLEPDGWRDGLAGCDTVVHLAALTGKASAKLHFDVNLGGTEALLDAAAAAGVGRFLFVSTIAVGFGDIRRYPYALAKKEAEAAVRRSGLGHVIVRPTMVFGPGSPVQKGFAALAKLPVSPVFDGGRARLQPIDVDDLATFIADVVRADPFAGATLEFGGPEVLSANELVGLMRTAAGRGAAGRLSLPTAPLRPLLSLLERIDPRLAPFTVGQLCTFRFDGVAEPNPYWLERSADLVTVPAMIASGAAS
ncbi:MAG: NAD(P)H-binding protein [Gemmatimonadota bacterium]|jgi:NADH dehydrogenase